MKRHEEKKHEQQKRGGDSVIGNTSGDGKRYAVSLMLLASVVTGIGDSSTYDGCASSAPSAPSAPPSEHAHSCRGRPSKYQLPPRALSSLGPAKKRHLLRLFNFPQPPRWRTYSVRSTYSLLCDRKCLIASSPAVRGASGLLDVCLLRTYVGTLGHVC